jgi:hypothetical protein
MAKLLLFVSVILSALPNFNLVNGLPLLDVFVLGMILFHAIRSKYVLVELLLFLCLVLAVLFYRISFNELDLSEYANFILRYVLFYGMLLIPIRFYAMSKDNVVWVIISVYLIVNVCAGVSQMVFQGLVRREIEYFYFNDINILFFTLLLTLFISRKRNPIIIFSVLILTIISGARLASLISIFYLVRNISKSGILFLLLLAISTYLILPQSWFENVLIFDRLSDGMSNDEYSRGALWSAYLASLFEFCTWCYIYQEFSLTGMKIMRPAHNYFHSC